MRIDIHRLKDSKTEVFREKLTASQLDIGTDDIRFDDAIGMTASVTKEMSMMYAKIHLSAHTECRCSRCSKKFRIPFEKDFTFQYPLDHEQRFIDVTKDIREEMILNYPVKLLCAEECKGVCPQCGRNLNQGMCPCSSK